MSDFGSELGNSGLAIMGKIIDALLKLIGKIYELIKERTSAEYKLKKAEYENMKQDAKEKIFAEKIEGMVGYVNHEDLVKAGVPLTAVGITLDDEGFKKLAERCKREGIVISGVEDIRERELTGKKTIIVECKQSDLVRLANLIDLMNDEKKIDLVQEEIQKLESKNQELKSELEGLKGKEDLTPEEADRIKEIEAEIEENNLVIEELNNQISDIRHEHNQELNQEQARGVVEQAVNGETLRGVTFDEAVDRWTGGNLDKDTTCFVVDAKDPDRYIVCNAKNDTFRNQDYIKTTYEVYNGSKQVYATNDGRFEGRPKDYWAREKAAMRDAGGFSDLVIKFYSVKELEAYRENFKAQNATELDKLGAGKEGRNYDEIIKSLETKLNECGAEYKEGIVINKESGKPITLTDSMSDVEMANAAEATVIGKQINNYMEIKQLESDVAIARTNVLTTDEGTNEHSVAQSVFEQTDSKYKAALDMETQLIDERKDINAIQAEHDVKMQEKEKPDDRRDERVSEIGDEKNTMAEYKGQIDKKKDNAAKGNDIKDRDVNRQNAIPKGKEDR
ncbi:hypothetical protein HDR58_09585 [bacterium]|nr:hypothetical protein [bacterium]